MIDNELSPDRGQTLYDLLSDAAPAGTPGRTETTRTIETSDESASPIEPLVSS